MQPSTTFTTRYAQANALFMQLHGFDFVRSGVRVVSTVC